MEDDGSGHVSDETEQLDAGSDDSADEDDPSTAEPGQNPMDPTCAKAFVLPSMFKIREPTVWFDYPEYMQMERQEGREQIVEHTDTKLMPLNFKSEKNINCITNACKRSGFRRLLKGSSFNLFWGHHLNEKALKMLLPRQAVNHFPGSFSLGRKDYLWKNLSRMQRQFGDAYDFCAKSYLFPRDREHFERDYTEGDVYILKPPAQAEGRGIRLMNRLDQLPGKSAIVMVQRYLGDPYVINNKKFDLRIYVGVTSFDPLRIYVFEEGLARFATSDYQAPDASRKSIKNRYMHLTNYSVNKKSENFERNSDATKDGEGSKWSLTALWKHLEGEGVDVLRLRERINDLIVKTIISAEHAIVSKMNAFCNGRASCFELFGFDVLLDKALKPWLIEVNVACSLASSSPLDKWIKNMVITDLFHMIGVVPFNKKGAGDDAEEKRKARLLGNGFEPLKRRNVFELQNTPLNQLDVEDLGIIMQAEDEHRRRGHWTRLLPCANMETKYLPFFEFARYKNTVLAKWMACQDWSILAPYMTPEALQKHSISLVSRVRSSVAHATPPASRPPANAKQDRRHSIPPKPTLKQASPAARRSDPARSRVDSAGYASSRSWHGAQHVGRSLTPPSPLVKLDHGPGGIGRIAAPFGAGIKPIHIGSDAQGLLVGGLLKTGLTASSQRLAIPPD